MDTATVLQRFVQHHRAAGSSPNTIRLHQFWLQRFCTFAHNPDCSALNATVARAFIASLQERGLAQHSVAGAVHRLKAFGAWLVAEEYLDKHPFARVLTPKVDDTPRDYFQPDDVRRLLQSCDRQSVVGRRDFALMLLLFSTGLRATECVSLTTADLDPAKQLILVRRGKGGRFRQGPYTPPVERAVNRYLRHPKRAAAAHAALFLSQTGTPLTRNGLEKLLDRRGQRVGLHVHPHKFRHTCAITYLRNGGRLEVLQKLLGHSRLDMTLHYARLAGVDVQQAHEWADPIRSLAMRV